MALRNAAGDLVLRVVYSGGQLPMQGSMVRPSPESGFVPHRTLGERLSSPGLRWDGTAWATNETPVGASGAIRVQLELDEAGAPVALMLRWEADPKLNYTLLSAESPEGPYSAEALAITSGEYRVLLEPGASAPPRFYRVSVP